MYNCNSFTRYPEAKRVFWLLIQIYLEKLKFCMLYKEGDIS